VLKVSPGLAVNLRRYGRGDNMTKADYGKNLREVPLSKVRNRQWCADGNRGALFTVTWSNTLGRWVGWVEIPTSPIPSILTEKFVMEFLAHHKIS